MRPAGRIFHFCAQLAHARYMARAQFPHVGSTRRRARWHGGCRSGRRRSALVDEAPGTGGTGGAVASEPKMRLPYGPGWEDPDWAPQATPPDESAAMKL